MRFAVLKSLFLKSQLKNLNFCQLQPNMGGAGSVVSVLDCDPMRCQFESTRGTEHFDLTGCPMTG